MRSPILNREFAFDPTGEIEALRMGEYPHSSGIIQVVDGPALDAIAANFAADKQKPNFPGLLCDFDHFSADVDKSSEAAGWITGLRRDGDSLLASVDWSLAGEQAVRSGRYRLFSPVFDTADMQNLGNQKMRPLRLESAGLTNAPNMKNLMPISNRAAGTVTDSEAAALSPRAAGEQISIIANRVKTEKGWTFDQAWNHVRGTESALFNRTCATPQLRDARAPDSKVTNRQQRDLRFASDRILELAKNRQQVRSIPFDRAWQEVCSAFPDLNDKAHGRVFNRAASEDISKSDWQKANSLSEKVFSFLHDEATQPVDRGTIIAGRAHLVARGLFRSAIARYMTDENMTRRQAFDYIKETEPIFWTQAMLNFDEVVA